MDEAPRESGVQPPDRRPWRVRTLSLIAAATLARILYLAFACPYTLVEDEAHYWDWSRHLDWSYYSKGPGVAWTIASSVRLLGESEFAIRLPAALASGVLLLCVAMLARDVTNRWRVAFYSCACVLLTPLLQMIGVLMTIDGPYAACWAMAMWAGWRGLGQRRRAYLPLCGLALAAGLLYKYTILLALPGLIWFAAAAGVATAALPRRSWVLPVAAALGLLSLGAAPILIWNAQNGWPTFSHLLGHLGVKGGDVPVTQGTGHWHYNPRWTLDYVGTQLGLIGPVLGFAVGQALRAWKHRNEDPLRWRGEMFLLVSSVPILAFYLLVSFLTEPEGNWPLAGYVTLMPLAGMRVANGLDELRDRTAAWLALPPPRPRAGLLLSRPTNLTRTLWIISLVFGTVTGLLIARMDWAAKLPLIGSIVPLHRFMGADVMAAHVHRLCEQVKAETGLEPFVISNHYGRSSLLAFYLPGRPVTYCSSSLMLSGRKSQFDLWTFTDLRRDQGLIGRPAVANGAVRGAWKSVFEKVEEVGRLDGDGKKDRPAFICRNFRGFPPDGLKGPPAR